MNGDGPVNGHVDSDKQSHMQSSQSDASKQATKITYEEYKAMATLLVIHCRQEEDKANSEMSEGNDRCFPLE